MLEKIHVVARHPLSRYYAYPKLNMGGVTITSVCMGYNYLYLLHHGRQDLAQQLVENEQLKWDPVMIEPWISQQNVTPNANFVAKADVIYSIIVNDQLDQKSSPFRKVFMDVVDNATNPSNLVFLMHTSAASREMIFSTGRKLEENVDNFPGLNVYGDILKGAVDVVLKRAPRKQKGVENLLDSVGFFLPSKRSVLIISDSQARYFDTVACGGLVVPVSGGRYRNIVDVIRNAEFSLNDFVWVIIYCGTNTYLRPTYSDIQRRQDFHELKDILCMEAKQREPDTILFSCAFDNPQVYGNSQHARWVQLEFHDTPVGCLNWRDEGNPFLDQNGRIVRRLFRPDGFHLNMDGARVLWSAFVNRLPGLRLFPYKLLSAPQSVNRDMFSDDTPRPPAPRKRKMV